MVPMHVYQFELLPPKLHSPGLHQQMQCRQESFACAGARSGASVQREEFVHYPERFFRNRKTLSGQIYVGASTPVE